MRLKIKRIMATFLVVVLLITMLPVNVTGVYAEGITEDTAGGMQAGKTEEVISSIDADVGKAAEKMMVTQPETQEITGKDESQIEVETSADASTGELEKQEEANEEESAAIVPETQQDTKPDTDMREGVMRGVPETENVGTDEASMPLFTSEETDSGEQQEEKGTSGIKLNNAMVEKTLKNAGPDDKVPLGFIMAADQWASGHFKWYVNTGDAGRHYIFCMEKGKVMKSGIFQPSKYSGAWGSDDNTFRIAVAMDYLKMGTLRRNRQSGMKVERKVQTIC